MAYQVRVAYFDAESDFHLDDDLNQLAVRFDGEWTGSGRGVDSCQRDLWYEFETEASAAAFAAVVPELGAAWPSPVEVTA